jgi:hypothetical protein
MPTVTFVINQPPQFARDSAGQVTSVVLIGQHIFARMTQLTMHSNGIGPTKGNLIKVAMNGRIDAVATEFAQVCNAVVGMVTGDSRTLEITGNDALSSFQVYTVTVGVSGATHVSDLRDLRVDEAEMSMRK